jgi:hypothetical protein
LVLIGGVNGPMASALTPVPGGQAKCPLFDFFFLGAGGVAGYGELLRTRSACGGACLLATS